MPMPGDPGNEAGVWTPRGHHPVRVALLALTMFVSGGVAASGASLALPGIGSVPVTTEAVRSEPAVVAAEPVEPPQTGAVANGSVGHAEAAPSPTSAPAPTRTPAAAGKRPAAPRSEPKPWLPTGTGMWIHEWSETMDGDAGAVVRKAEAHGVTTLYVRTGTLDDGFVGAPILRRLLPATKGTGVRVVAWDFPMLDHPRREARRLAQAVRYRPPGTDTPRVTAVAPDIETPAEGTRLTRKRVSFYLRTLRRLLPDGTSVLTTVPWPSEHRRGEYPYGAAAKYSHALLPMAYWYNRDPHAVTTYSIRWLRRYDRPVLPVGQGFDSKIDAPYLKHSKQRREIAGFMRAARAAKVPAISLWSWQTAGDAQWDALARHKRAFR